MVIECEVCGSYTELEEMPMNNICPVCFHFGSLFVQTNPTKKQLEEIKRMFNNET